MSKNFYRDNEDLQFYLERGIDWEPLVELTEHDFQFDDGFDDTEEAVDYYHEVIEMVGRFVADEIDPHTQEIDREGLELIDGEVEFPEKLDEIFEKIKPLELHGLTIPRELGGMNCPLIVYMLMTEIFGRADVSISAHHGFHGGMATALLAYSVEEGTTEFDEETGRIVETRFEDEIREILSGEAWGSMDITEPGAGSDMASLRTRAEQDEEGNWSITGQKIFITSGHGKYHVVIARTEEDDGEGAMSGLDGLSTFLVQTYEENEEGERVRHATVERLEEKMGHHASATCAIRFDETPAELIGERGEGFEQMLMLMNNARVAVSFESIGLCENAYRIAKDFASQRESMGKTIDQHEIIADYLDEMKTDIQGMRALAVYGSYHEELSRKIRMGLERGEVDEDRRERLEAQREESTWEARRTTPLLKYLAAEKAVEMARRCVQIHGGVGYTTEYEAEKLLRDAVVMPIYEGTSQIQALMATKDTLSKVMEAPQGFVKDLARARWRTWSASNSREANLARVRLAVARAKRHLISKTAVEKFKEVSQKPVTDWADELSSDWDPKRDFAHALLHAERLTRMLADEAICEILHEQARKYPERRQVFDRYVERAIPRCESLYDEIVSRGDRLIGELHAEQETSTPRAAE